MPFKCKECGKEFDTQKDLHKHFKSHGLIIGEYYVKNYQRKDLLTGDLLPFNDVESYFLKDFRSENSFKLWCESGKITKEYILDIFKKRIDSKGWNEFPCETEIKTCSSCFLPEIKYIKKYFGSCFSLAKELGVNLILKDNFLSCENINSQEIEKRMKVAIDTREQLPFDFKNKTVMKLDVGDYTALDNKYSNTYVDRKNPQDFIQTITSGFDRFSRELERVKELDAYLFIVVEDSIENLKNPNRRDFHKANVKYVFSKMNDFQHKYPNNCQFVFADNRDMAKKLVLKILYNGKNFWGVDLQYLLDNKK